MTQSFFIEGKLPDEHYQGRHLEVGREYRADGDLGS